MSLNLNESKIQLIHFIHFVSFYIKCYRPPLKRLQCVKRKMYFLLIIKNVSFNSVVVIVTRIINPIWENKCVLLDINSIIIGYSSSSYMLYCKNYKVTCYVMNCMIKLFLMNQ